MYMLRNTFETCCKTLKHRNQVCPLDCQHWRVFTSSDGTSSKSVGYPYVANQLPIIRVTLPAVMDGSVHPLTRHSCGSRVRMF